MAPVILSGDEKTQLVNDLIKENRDATIADYLETLKEIEYILQTNPR